MKDIIVRAPGPLSSYAISAVDARAKCVQQIRNIKANAENPLAERPLPVGHLTPLGSSAQPSRVASDCRRVLIGPETRPGWFRNSLTSVLTPVCPALRRRVLQKIVV